MRLYITEKPKTAKQLCAVLGQHRHVRAPGPGHFAGHKEGDGWRVLWLSGHMYFLLEPHDIDPNLRSWRLGDLPIIHTEPKWKVKDTPDYPPPEEVRVQIELAKKLYKDTTELILATDADQEGQVLGQVFLQETGWTGPVRRFWTDLWAEEGVRAALANVRDNSEFQGEYDAGVARIVCDQMVGINLTRFFSIKADEAGHSFVANVGRVQSPAGRIAVAQHKRHIEHTARHYYTASATLEHHGVTFEADMVLPDHLLDDGSHCFDRAAVEALVAQAQGEGEARVASVREQRKETPPPLPFSPNTLSQHCSKHFHMMPDEVDAAAQSLYEQGYLSYPRGDSEAYETSLLGKIPATFKALATLGEPFSQAVANANLQSPQPVFVDANVDSHSALFVDTTVPTLSSLTEHERNVYCSVAMRLIQQFYPSKITSSTRITLTIGGQVFACASTVLISPGWSVLEAQDDDKDGTLVPKINTGDLCQVRGFELGHKRTKAPDRMTVDVFQATLKDCTHLLSPEVRKRIGHGMLGTGATQGQYLKNLCKQKILKIEDKKFVVPTRRGLEVHGHLPDTIASPDLSSLWELHFRAIRAGHKTGAEFIESVAQWLGNLVEKYRDVKFSPAPTMTPCERCGTALRRRAYRNDSNRFYWRCGNEECGIMTPDDWGKPVSLHPMHGKPCPKPGCGGKLTTRIPRETGKSKKRTSFAGCSDVNCKYSEN